MSKWEPIETAPKDGTRVLCFTPGNPEAKYAEDDLAATRVDHTRNGRWWNMRPDNPYTHWQPLPPPPEQGE